MSVTKAARMGEEYDPLLDCLLDVTNNFRQGVENENRQSCELWAIQLPGASPRLSPEFYQNAELVTLTYGSIVAQLCKDYEGDYLEVNKQLDKMGYNIGLRLIEDYLAKTAPQRCANFRETAEMIARVRLLV